MTGSTSARPTQPGTKMQSTPLAGQSSRTQRDAHAEPAGRDPYSTAFHPRIEPSLDEPGFPSAANTAYERLHGLGPDFGEYCPPGRSRIWRITMMLGVFVVGAGVGLAAAWWLHRPAQVAAVPASPVRATQALPSAEGRRPVVIRGISPSELPYDGAPPPVSETLPTKADTGPPLSAGMTSGGSDIEPQDRTGSGKSAGGAADQDVSVVAPTAKVAAGKRVPEPAAAVTDVEDGRNAARENKQASASVADAAPKRRAASKSATDREIERIRRQADEELKKKTEQGRASEGARNGAHLTNGREASRKIAASSSASREASTRAMLVRCDRSSNFIRREICRWRVCNGSWGRYGCPSYKSHTPSY